MRIWRYSVEGYGETFLTEKERAEFAPEKLNCSQESDISMWTLAAKMACMKRSPLAGRTNESKRHGELRGIYLYAILLAFAWLSVLARGQDAPAAQAAATARTTVVIFPARPMPEDEWSALFAAVQAVATAEKIEGAGGAEFVRGDTMRPGLTVENAVVVYLLGNCDLEPLPRRTAYSVRLGWVIREDGHRENGPAGGKTVEQGSIDPYIHVDCTHIGQVLGPQARGLDREARDRMMAGAMARVLVHEWIHITRQTAEHGRNGITKASFGVPDLLGDPDVHLARR
jgi:hypothetical protein